MPSTYTVKQVADILGYSTNSIYTFLKEKRIKGVRVGKGRFRIPEEELSRLLHSSKKSDTAIASVPQTPAEHREYDGSAEVVIRTKEIITFLGKAWLMPDLFDWMVGVGAILSGFGLFLFNRSYQPAVAEQYLSSVQFMRWILIASGFGLLISSVLPKTDTWHRFFKVILAVTGLMNAWMLFKGGDVDGAVVYGLVALLVGVSAAARIDGILMICWYLTGLALAAPALLYFGGADLHIKTLLSALSFSAGTGMYWAVGCSAAFLILIWNGYRKNGTGFWVGIIASGLMLVGASVFNAMLQFWSRSFFLLVIAVTCLFVPFMQGFRERNRPRQRALLIILLGMIGTVMMASIVVVGVVQNVLWEQNQAEFQSKTAYGRQMVEGALESVRGTMVTAAKNPDIIKASEEGDSARLETLSKVIYEGNPNIRRLVFVSADGEGLALYPHGTFDQLDLSFREYFRIVRDTRSPYISDVYTALADGAHRKVVSVTVPLINEQNELAGVLTGSVDVIRIGGRLQAVAIGSTGEYFIVSDSKGKIAISPNPADIGGDLDRDDVLRKALAGQAGVELSRMQDGTLGMLTYAPLESNKWAVSLRAPANRIYALNQGAMYMIFSVIGVVILACLLWMIALRVRVPGLMNDGGGGP